MHTHTDMTCTHMNTHMHMHTGVHTNMHTHAHTHMHTDMPQICTHTCTRAHTPTTIPLLLHPPPAPPVCVYTPSPKKAPFPPAAHPSGSPPLPPAPAPTGGDSDSGGDSGSRCVRCCRVPHSNCPRCGPGGGGVASRPGGAALGTIGAGPGGPGGPGTGSGVRSLCRGVPGCWDKEAAGSWSQRGRGATAGGQGTGTAQRGHPGPAVKLTPRSRNVRAGARRLSPPRGAIPDSAAWHGTARHTGNGTAWHSVTHGEWHMAWHTGNDTARLGTAHGMCSTARRGMARRGTARHVKRRRWQRRCHLRSVPTACLPGPHLGG